jgi:hypothetical protein
MIPSAMPAEVTAFDGFSHERDLVVGRRVSHRPSHICTSGPTRSEITDHVAMPMLTVISRMAITARSPSTVRVCPSKLKTFFSG